VARHTAVNPHEVPLVPILEPVAGGGFCRDQRGVPFASIMRVPGGEDGDLREVTFAWAAASGW